MMANNGWMLNQGVWLNFYQINDQEDYYQYIKDSEESIELLSRYIEIHVKDIPKPIKRISVNDDKNDCLFSRTR